MMPAFCLLICRSSFHIPGKIPSLDGYKHKIHSGLCAVSFLPMHSADLQLGECFPFMPTPFHHELLCLSAWSLRCWHVLRSCSELVRRVREFTPSGVVLPQSGDPAILAYQRIQCLPTELQAGVLGVNGLTYVCQANTVTDSTVLTSKVFPSSLREAPSQAARRHGQPLDEPARALSAAGVRSMDAQVPI